MSIGFDVTISQPYIVAAMTELLQLEPGNRVLEIGTGSGYQAAVLSLLVRSVYSIERVPQLADSATALLRRLGFSNIFVRAGDGFRGWPEEAPFDRIVLTAAPLHIPGELVRQLAARGRIVAPVGQHDRQDLVVIEKNESGALDERAVFPVSFVPMLPG